MSSPWDGLWDESWGAVDETLADEPLTADPPAAARPWLASQRCMHGLLRAMHGADAQAAEVRIQRILAATVAVPLPRQRWGLVAAAALVLCLLAGLAFWPARLPQAEAAVARAVELLAEEVDRRFVFAVALLDADDREQLRQEFELTARPGMRVLVEGNLALGTLQLGRARLGCDGHQFWFAGGMNGQFRRAVPLAEAERLLSGVGDVLDVGYLDLHALVERLPSTFELRTVGRSRATDGRRLLHIEAHGTPRRADVRLQRAELWCDEVNGMITRMVVEAEGSHGLRRRVEFEYRGTLDAALVSYGKPW